MGRLKKRKKMKKGVSDGFRFRDPGDQVQLPPKIEDAGIHTPLPSGSYPQADVSRVDGDPQLSIGDPGTTFHHKHQRAIAHCVLLSRTS